MSSRRNQVDPEVLRKARRIVEIYHLKPQVTDLLIMTKVFPVTYSKDGWLYLNYDYFTVLRRQIEYMYDSHCDIQGVEFTFDTMPSIPFVHSVLFDDNNWRTVSAIPPTGAKFAISLTGPLQYNGNHRRAKKPTYIKTVRSVDTNMGPAIVPCKRLFEFPKLVMGDNDLYINLPLLGHYMIDQKFKGIVNAKIIMKYVKVTL